MIKVSVVIPVYNVEKYLPACLDSVLGQTLREIEVICIDDASPDRCGEILDDYAERDSRVRVIHLKKNMRQGYGRNRGMDAAAGQYIYFLDSDDMITPEALEELYTLAERDCLQGIFFDSQVIYDSEELRRRYSSYPSRRNGEYPDAVIPGQELFDLFVRQNEWTCYVQREFWNLGFLRENDIRFPDGVEHEDELLPFEGLLLADRVRYIPKDYFIRRYREASVMTTPPTAKNFHGYFMNFVKMDEFVRRHGIHNFGADRNMFRMFQVYERYYAELKDKCDLSEWFRPDELPIFHFYDRMRTVREYLDTMRGELIDELRKYPSIYIYGAGVLGQRAIRALSAYGFSIDGILVSDTGKNPPTVLGHRVRAMADLQADKDRTVILLAMTKGFIDEVEPSLEADGWHCLSFNKY